MTQTRTIAMAATLALALMACSDDSGTTGGDGPPADRLVYQADTSPTAIMVMNADGTDRHEVGADIPGLDRTNPDWSPDGSTLVFGVTDNGVDSLWTASADGTSSKMLLECVAPCVYYDDPAYSPDGSKVAYARMALTDGATVATLETVDVQSGVVTVLSQGDEEHFFAGVRWSPDGQSLVFEYVHKTGPTLDAAVDGVELSIIDVAAGATSRRALTDPATFAATADWGPNGDVIVFSALPSTDASAPDLFTIRPDGTQLTRITTLADAGGSAEEPAWSGDGASIWFKANVAGAGSGLATVARTGGEVLPAVGDAYVPGRHPRLHKA
jgi:Tol biopolymer transport system component